MDYHFKIYSKQWWRSDLGKDVKNRSMESGHFCLRQGGQLGVPDWPPSRRLPRIGAGENRVIMRTPSRPPGPVLSNNEPHLRQCSLANSRESKMACTCWNGLLSFATLASVLGYPRCYNYCEYWLVSAVNICSCFPSISMCSTRPSEVPHSQSLFCVGPLRVIINSFVFPSLFSI